MYLGVCTYVRGCIACEYMCSVSMCVGACPCVGGCDVCIHVECICVGVCTCGCCVYIHVVFSVDVHICVLYACL